MQDQYHYEQWSNDLAPIISALKLGDPEAEYTPFKRTNQTEREERTTSHLATMGDYIPSVILNNERVHLNRLDDTGRIKSNKINKQSVEIPNRSRLEVVNANTTTKGKNVPGNSTSPVVNTATGSGIANTQNESQHATCANNTATGSGIADTQNESKHATHANNSPTGTGIAYALNKSRHATPANYNVINIASIADTSDKPQQATAAPIDSMEDEEILKDSESLDFPFAAPPPKVDATSPEYQGRLLDAINESVRVKSPNNLNNNQKDQLVDRLIKWKNIFSIEGENLGQTDAAVHEIETGNNKPFRERLRIYSPAMQPIIDAEVDKMVKEGIIVKSKSPYASNLLLVRKPDPSSPNGIKDRVCVNFIRLNEQTEKDSYPLPNIQWMFAKIGGAKYFTTMDLLSGFWQIMIKPEHRYKTAFNTMRGLYEFVVMPFGLCNAPATFQRLMDNIILPEYRDFIQTYIDDVMVYSNTFEDHLKHMDKVCELLAQHNLKVKLKKCKFACERIEFLGHIISQNKITVNPRTVDNVRNWIKPKGGGTKAKSAIRGLIGLTGWYHKFIPHYAEIAQPLFNLTRDDVPFEWTDQCQKAFDTFKDHLTRGPVLAVANPNKPYVLHTDASDFALGALLMQEDDNGDLHPIAYASKTLNSAQRNYDTTDREALALVWALEHFNTFVEGHNYTIITDHRALETIMTKRNSEMGKYKKFERYALRLAPYNIKVMYSKGSENHAADLLSRQHDLMEIKGIANGTTADFAPLAATNLVRRKPRTIIGRFEVERIVAQRPIQGRANEFEYLIKWRDHDETECTWEPIQHLKDASHALTEFYKTMESENAYPTNITNITNTNINTSVEEIAEVPSAPFDPMILPVVICLSQRLSHACLSINIFIQ